MTTAGTTRSATRDDGHAIRELVGAVLDEFGFPLESDGIDADLADVVANYTERGGTFDVIVEHGRIVGCAGIYPIENAPDGTRVAELRKMYLLPEVRGRGYGRALLERALASARERGFGSVVLESSSKMTDAIALYRRAGFADYVPQVRHATRCNVNLRLPLSPAPPIPL